MAIRVDLRQAFATFKKKGKKRRNAELTRLLAKLLTGGGKSYNSASSGTNTTPASSTRT